MKRLCTICARGGSKGVPGKNIRPMLGKPLIAWTVSQALESGLFEYVAVSSDDDAILKAAEAAGATLLIKRPDDLATDSAAKLPAILHAVRTAEESTGEIFDTLVDLDATSPLRLVEDIVGAVEQLESSERPNIITAAPARRSPYFNLVEQASDGSVHLSKSTGAVVRRQDAPPTFDMNASIYVWRRDVFIAGQAVFYPTTGLYVMPDERSVDIDSELDFEIVEMLLGRRSPRPAATPRSPFDLTGKTAVVTGAAGILGTRFCTILAQHGARVAAIDIDGAEAVADELRQRFGAVAAGYAVDVSDAEAALTAVKRIEAEIGPIDILHNNAATKGPDLARFFDSAENFSPEIWRQIMQVNVDGYFFMARAAGPLMAARGRGSIVQTSSIYGILGPDQRIYEGSEYMGMPINTPAVYSASKASVVGLTKYFATYWGAKGVRVNTLTPGGVASGQNDVFEKRYSARVPLGRMAQPDDLANALLYLASDASSYVTGQNLVVDGGLSAW